MQIYQHIKEHTPRGQHLEETRATRAWVVHGKREGPGWNQNMARKVTVEKSVDHRFVYIYKISTGLPPNDESIAVSTCRLTKLTKP